MRIILCLVGMLAISAYAAGYKKVTFQDSDSKLEMRLYFDSLQPGRPRYLEYSGDYREKKAAYRIFAQEDFYVEAGAYKGWAEEHFLEKRTSADEPADLTLQEYEFTATLADGKGDTLTFETGSLTPYWKVGAQVYRVYHRADGSVQEGSIPIIAMDDLQRVFPDIPEHSSGVLPSAQASESFSQLMIYWPSVDGRLTLPSGATRVEAFDMSGQRIYSGAMRAGAAPELPPAMRADGIFYVRFY